MQTKHADNADNSSEFSEFIEEPWDMIEQYFKGNHLERLVRHQIESYNNFINYQIFRTIEMFNPVVIRPDKWTDSVKCFDSASGKHRFEVRVTFANLCATRPQIQENNGATKLMFPQEARLRNFSYASTLFVDVNFEYIVRSGDNLETVTTYNKTFPKKNIGKMPIMLNSDICVLKQYKHIEHQHTGECKYDPGGYFIITGSEKTILGQERTAENRVYCFNIQKNAPKYLWSAEVRSIPDTHCISPKQINLWMSSKNTGLGHPIYVNLARLKKPIPLFIMFRAMGMLSDKEICEYILLDITKDKHAEMLDNLQASIIEANNLLREVVEIKMKDICKKDIDIIKKKYESVEENGADDGADGADNATTDDEAAPEADTAAEDTAAEGCDGEDDDGGNSDSDNESTAEDRNDNEDEVDEGGVDKPEHTETEYPEAEDGDEDNTNKFDESQLEVSEEDRADEINARVNKCLDDVSNISDYFTQENAINYIMSHIVYLPPTDEVCDEMREAKRREFAMDILKNDLYPHCPTHKQKLLFLGYMANRIMQVHFGWRKVDDRDSYANKRIDLAGVLLNNLFRNYFNKLVKDMEREILKEIKKGNWRSTDSYEDIVNKSNMYKIVKSSTIEKGLKRALSTGDFGIKHIANSNKVGVAQLLIRLTYTSSLSHLRRISTPTDKNGKLIPPRKLHNTAWGFLCPAETPEGHSVGVVKNLSYMCHVTINSNSSSIIHYLNNHITSMDNVAPVDMFNQTTVFINGCPVGIAKDPITLYNYLKRLKHTGELNIYTSIVFDYANQEIKICNEAGRVTRPLILVRNNKIAVTPKIVNNLREGSLSWDDLFSACRLSESVMEYIDPEEQQFSMIATTPSDITDNPHIRYTHCEIHASTIFGVVASCIPFSDHNQSPRNTYQCAQGKQAMGVYATNYDARMDKTAYVLNYTSRPLVDTRVMNFIKLHEMPSGCNINVAIMTHTGYNQEDSVLVNQGSIDRGLFQATVFHTEKDEDKQKINGDAMIRCRPNSAITKGMKMGGNYSKINSKGVIPENELVENRDIIMAKILPIKKNKMDQTKLIKYEDMSKIYKTTEETYVDKNYIGKNGDGYTFCKVRLRATCKPTIGDKFSSRHGQKGTIGNIIPEADMPYTKSGVRPDIIINPHAIPSRMTIGQLKETILGKVLVELGLYGDGTSFGDLKIDNISKLLLKLGHEAHGDELMYSGLTGEQIECKIFMGPVFYQRLKHMVSDKQHSRSFGPMVNFTRQPADGRSRDGGLRFGEMERDCGISHGAARFTKERLFDVSDKYSVHTCNKCGLIAAYNKNSNINSCKSCDNYTNFSHINLPYSCKLLFQELITMNVVPRIMTTAGSVGK